MDIVTVFLIFMITTSITLTGFVIRQRKNNRMLGELVAQTKVESTQRYSSIGIGLQNDTYVLKCPFCAEWINLEAKVCKSCQNDVESHNLKARESVVKIDAEITEASLSWDASKKRQREALIKHPHIRLSAGLILIIMIILFGLRVQSTLSYNKATEVPSSSFALARSWNSIVEECQFLAINPKLIIMPSARKDEYGSVSLWIQLGRPLSEFDWNTPLGQASICFSKKALGVDVSKKLDPNVNGYINLRNSFSIYGKRELTYIGFDWSKRSLL